MGNEGHGDMRVINSYPSKIGIHKQHKSDKTRGHLARAGRVRI
jgi:hypothetical protein